MWHFQFPFTDAEESPENNFKSDRDLYLSVTLSGISWKLKFYERNAQDMWTTDNDSFSNTYVPRRFYTCI